MHQLSVQDSIEAKPQPKDLIAGTMKAPSDPEGLSSLLMAALVVVQSLLL